MKTSKYTQFTVEANELIDKNPEELVGLKGIPYTIPCFFMPVLDELWKKLQNGETFSTEQQQQYAISLEKMFLQNGHNYLFGEAPLSPLLNIKSADPFIFATSALIPALKSGLASNKEEVLPIIIGMRERIVEQFLKDFNRQGMFLSDSNSPSDNIQILGEDLSKIASKDGAVTIHPGIAEFGVNVKIGEKNIILPKALFVYLGQQGLKVPSDGNLSSYQKFCDDNKDIIIFGELIGTSQKVSINYPGEVIKEFILDSSPTRVVKPEIAKEVNKLKLSKESILDKKKLSHLIDYLVHEQNIPIEHVHRLMDVSQQQALPGIIAQIQPSILESNKNVLLPDGFGKITVNIGKEGIDSVTQHHTASFSSIEDGTKEPAIKIISELKFSKAKDKSTLLKFDMPMGASNKLDMSFTYKDISKDGSNPLEIPVNILLTNAVEKISVETSKDVTLTDIKQKISLADLAVDVMKFTISALTLSFIPPIIEFIAEKIINLFKKDSTKISIEDASLPKILQQKIGEVKQLDPIAINLTRDLPNLSSLGVVESKSTSAKTKPEKTPSIADNKAIERS
jgi:hypothetical protein